jgi:HlyD family secretion protein
VGTTVDVRALAIDRRAATRPPGPPGGVWRLTTRYLIPGAVLVGFVAAAAWSAREAFLPAVPVTVLPVVATRAEVRAADTPLFTAAGWVEARPTPVIVAALAEGVVERLLVIEGQDVKAGEPVAQLIDADARLSVRDAEAHRDTRHAERDAARAALDAAAVNLREPLERQAMLAEAEAALARIETELARLPHQTAASAARRELARQELDAKVASQGATPALALARARADAESAEAALAELKARAVALARERDSVVRRRDHLARQLELKVAETRQNAEATAALRLAEARLRQAEVALEVARLRLERMTVRAPTAGRVLGLVARPGSKLMGLTPAAAHDASTVVTLYDPARLQVRADVRLEDVPRVRTGQSVRVESPAVGGAMVGHVLSVTSITDIQKNTLQVKVALDEPPAVLKPDMLVQLTFLAPPRPAGGDAPVSPLRLLVPRSLVRGEGTEAFVWVADLAAGVARRRAVVPGGAVGNDLVEITGGLAVGDRLIVTGREGLAEGKRVRVTGEESGGGTPTAPAAPAPHHKPSRL